MVKRVTGFIGMAAGMGVLGIALAVLGAYIGGGVIGEKSFGALGLAIIGVVAGYLLGIVIGLVVIKKVMHRNGSLAFGILGSIFGTAIIVIIGASIDIDSNALLIILFFLAVPVFSLGGYYLRR